MRGDPDRRSPLELVGIYLVRMLEERRPTYHDLEPLPAHLPHPERIRRRSTRCGRKMLLTSDHLHRDRTYHAATILPLRFADVFGRPCTVCAKIGGRLL